MEVNDPVWVKTGDIHEEPAVVERLNCDYEDEQGALRQDGILVRLSVSRYKLIYPPSQVRPISNGGKSRTFRAMVTPSPVEDKKPQAKRKRRTIESNEKSQRNLPKAKAAKPLEVTTPESIRHHDIRMNTRVSKFFRERNGWFNGTVVAYKDPYFKVKFDDSDVEELSAEHCRRAIRAYQERHPAKASPIQNKLPEDNNVAKTKSTVEVIDESEHEDASDVDTDDPDDMPFAVEYSPTSRATCRRCDEVIQKGSLRVSHIPLFRGKPGFRIYRHLHCAIFSENINDVKQVGGWSKLRKSDIALLSARIQESLIEIQKENEDLQPDELVQSDFNGEMRRNIPGLAANLLPFQVEGISWMYHQEKYGEVRGGILADEMGMGKTLQTIAVMLDNKPRLQHCKAGMKHPPTSPDLELRIQEEEMWSEAAQDWKHEMEMNNVPKRLLPKKHGGTRAGTLVVCPVVALSQWKSEIEKFTDSCALTVGVYHGPDRSGTMPSEMIQKYDVVLTTYQVLEQDFRKMTAPNKVACPNCGGKFKIDKLKVHLKYFCGETAQKTEAQARQHRVADRQRSSGKKASSAKQKGKKKARTPPEKADSVKIVDVKSGNRVDSDSESSIGEGQKGISYQGRPARSAAVDASRKMTSSVAKWGSVEKPKGYSSRFSDDDSSFSSKVLSESDSDDGTDFRDSGPISKPRLVRKKSPNKLKLPNSDIAGLERAKEKQRKAMTSAAKPRARQSMGTGKKTFDVECSDSSESDENLGDDDPLAGIDMKALLDVAMNGSRFSVLHSFCWWRIVLDEAHYIKSRSSQTSASAFALTGIHRWCLSGTPLQNRVGELYSLIRFLRIEPMAYYFCRQKGCTCKSLHYRMKDGFCQDCEHRAFAHYAHFNKHVLNPIQRDGYSGDGRRAMFKLKNEVLDKCLLRRTKETKAEDMNLPPRIVTIRSVKLHPIEEDFYKGLYTESRATFDDYVNEGTLLNNYAHIFDLLTKMRQAVDHPYLTIYSKKNSRKMLSDTPVANGKIDCDICHESLTDRVASSCCGYFFCRSCVVEYLTGASSVNTPCPSCEQPFSIDLTQRSSDDNIDDGILHLNTTKDAINSSSVPSLKELKHVQTGSILRRINLADFATSSKIEVLVQELLEMRRQRPGSKALVFSQFVNMLDLIRWRITTDPFLEDVGLGVRILHGGMDVKSRDETLKEFREDSNVRVLLMSLKAGGVALNLTVASEVYLVDNWWNPAAEMQAIDRTHRLGQYRPIRAVRFIAEGTVEERVLQLQEKKRLVFDGTVGRDAGSLSQLSADDMRALFT